MGIVSSAKKIAKTPAVQQSVKTNKLLKEYEDWASANGITRKPTTATSKLTIPEWGDNFTAEQKSVMNAMYTDIMYQNDIASFERQRTLGQKNTPYVSTPPISHTSSNTSAAAPSVSYKPQTAAEHIAVPNNGTFARTSLFTAAGDNALPALSTNTRNISSSQISRPSTSVTAPASTYSDLQSRMSILRQEIQDETDSTRRDELTKEYNSIKDYAAQNYQQGAKSRLADMSVNRTQLETRKTWLENQKAELQKQYAISVTQNAGNATSANTNANFDQTLSEITDPFVRQKVLEARRQYNNNPDQYNATALNSDAAQAYQKLGAVNSELSSINAQLDQLKNSGEGYFLTKNAENGYPDMQYQPDFSGAKQAIVFIDNPQNSNPASATRKIVVSDSEYWGLMTDTEKQTMNYIAEKQGNDAAAKYVSEYLMPSLLQRRYEAQKSALPSGQDITFGQGVALFGASTVANFLSSPKAAANMYAQRMMRGLSGNEYNAPLNAYNAAAYETQLSNDVMSGTLGQDLNDRFGTVELPLVGERGLGDLVSMGSSTVQSVATALLGSAGFGAVGLGAMGSAVTMQSYYDGISRGLSEDQALAYAAASGIAEVLTEKVSLESILNVESGPALLKILKQAGVEGSEEIASQLLQTAADEIISGDKSQLSQAVATYMDQGMTYDQAKKAAGNDWVKDTLFQGFAGFAQGGVMAGAARGFSAAYNSAQTRRDNRTSQTQETPVQPSQAPTGTSPSPGTPAAAKEAADALTSTFKQSEDEKTYAVNSDGERNIVTPLIIKNVGTDETSVTVRDAQGSTFSVPLSEVEFATNMGDDYAYAAGMANDEVANAFLANVGDAAHKEDIAAGMNFVYERATEGRKLESIQKSVIAQPLNEQQFRAAYDLGVNQRTEKIAQEQAAATERRKNLPFKVGTIDYGEIDMASLNETQRERATLAAEIVSLSGVNVHLFESKPDAEGIFRGTDGELAPNGYYVGSTGDIYLDINAGRNVAADAMTKVFTLGAAAHELTHPAKKSSPKAYYAYQDAVIWYMEQDGVDIDALIDNVMSRDKSVTTREIALEEIAANVAAPLLGTTDFVDKLYAARPQQALTLGQKIVEFIKKLKDRITRAYKGVTMPKEARLVMKNLDEIGKLWSDMMADAARLNETEAQEAPAEVATVAPKVAEKAEKPAGTVGLFDEPAMPESYHIDRRTWQDASDRGLPAFVNAYKMSRYFMGQAANVMLADLDSTAKAMGRMPTDEYAREWISQNRVTTDKIAYLLDGGVSYTDLNRVLGKLVEAQSDAEMKLNDSQALKRIELVLDEMLSNGYETSFGKKIPPDRDYLEYKAALPGAAGEAIPENAVSGSFAEFADAGVRYSVRERDAEYLSAVERGDMEAAQEMVDEAAKAAGYTIKAYHGTTAKFNTFRFTSDDIGIHLGTKGQARMMAGRGKNARIVSAYVRLKNPLHFSRDLGGWYPLAVSRELLDTDVITVPEAEGVLLSTDKTYRRPDSDATIRMRKLLQEKGYDGFDYINTHEGYSTNPQKSIAVFDKNAIKLADPVTYSADGSVIPLSERFNAGNEDIRYSVRDPEEISTREVLATALEGAAQNERERNMLASYKEQIKKYDGIQKDIAEKRARIRELTFGKYERTTATRDELTKLKNQVSVLWDQLARQDSTLLKLEAMEPLKALGEREQSKAVAKVRAQMNEKIKAIREQRDTKLAEQKQQTQERIQRMREGRKDTETRHKMLKIVDDFNKRLVKPREGYYVPDSLRDAIMALNEGDIKTTRGNEAHDKLNRILAAYKAIKDVEGFETAFDSQLAEYVEGVAESLDERSKRNGKPLSIYDLSGAELTGVYNVLRGIKHAIQNAVKLVSDTKNRDAYALGLQARQEIVDARGKYPSDFVENRIAENLDAYGSFMRYGNQDENGAMMALYDMISSGELDKSRYEQGANAIFESLIKGMENQNHIRKLRSYAAKDLVDVGFKDASGNAVKMTRGMMIMAYLHLDSPQNLLHVMYGGLTLPELNRYYNHSGEAWGTGSRRTAGVGALIGKAWQGITRESSAEEKAAAQAKTDEIREREYARLESIRAQIESGLTDYERRFIEASRQFLDGYSKQIMNEASMKRFGFEIATVEKYVPINTDPRFRKAKFDAYVGEMSLEGIGIAKARIEGASNPIRLYDVTDAMRTHIGKVSLYAAMINPVHDFTKVYNTMLRGHEDTLQAALSDKFGERAVKWVHNYLEDAQGLRDKGEITIFDKVKGNYAGGVLIANIGSALKNYTSYFGAPAVVGWKHTLHALARGGKNNWILSGADKTLIGKYTPLLNDRMRGMTTKELGDINQMIGWGGRIGGKIDVAKLRGLLNLINKTDAAATGRIWYAAQYYVDENFPGLAKGTQAQIDAGESPYYQKVAEVFNKTLRRTQQTYTASELADVLRNPDKIVRSMTMFMSQPLKQFGMIYNAAAELRAKSRAARTNGTAENKAALKKARIQMANVTTSFVVMNITEILAGALGMMIAHRKPWEDDESFLKWLGVEALGNLIGTVAYGNLISDFVTPFIKGDQYYGIESGAIAPLADLGTSAWRAITGAQKLFETEFKDDAERNEAIAKYLKGAGLNLGFNLSRIFGIPAQNVYKFGNGLYLHAQDILNGEFGSFNAGAERTDAYFYGQLYDLAAARDKTGFQTRLAEVMEEREVTESDALSGVREAIGDAYIDGKIDALTANALLADYVGERDKDRKKTLGEWNYKRDTGESYSDMKELYLDGSLTLSQAVEARVKYGMVDKTTATDTVNEWRYELDTGRVWDEMGADMLNGKITEAAAKNYLTKYGGKSDADANEKINEWIYEDATGRDFTRYSYVYDALDAGSKATFNTAVSDMVADYGMEREDIKAQARKYINGLVSDGNLPPARAISLRENMLGETFTDVERNLQLNEYEYILANGSADGYTKYGKYHDALYKAVQDSDTAAFEKAMQTTISETGLSETDVYEDVRGLVRKAMTSGEIDAETAREYITSFGGKEANEAYWTVREWEYGINGGEGSFSRYNDFLGAIETGNGLTGYATELLDHGTDRSTIARQISDVYRKEYIRLKETNPTAANALLNKILPAYEAIGYSREYEIDYISKNWK